MSKSVITWSYDIMGERFSTQSVKKCDYVKILYHGRMFFNSKCQKVWLREVTISWENIFQLKVSKSVITRSYDNMGERFSKCQKVWLREVTISWENVIQLKVSKSVITRSYNIMGECFLTESAKKCDPELRNQGLLYNCSTPSSLLGDWDRSATKHDK